MDTNNLQLRAKEFSVKNGPAPAKLESIQTPEQFLGLIENPELRDFVSLILMGQEMHDTPSCPKWAANAAKELFNGIFASLSPKRRKSKNYRLGFLMGLSRKWVPELLKVEKQLATVYLANDFTALAQAAIQQEPDLAVAEFHQGCADGILQGDKITPGATAGVYGIISFKWSEMTELKNVGQVQSWLENYLPTNLVGSRDRIAKLCQKIRFPLTDKGGRPKSKPRKV